jgi:hypothetical protein
MGEKKEILWSVWLTKTEDEAVNRLIDILLEKKLIKNGPKGFVSRRLLLEYLIYNAIFHFKSEILSQNQEVETENGKEENPN